MTELTTTVSAPKTDEEYEVAISGYFDEIDQLRLKMHQDQSEIDRLKAETRAILTQLAGA